MVVFIEAEEGRFALDLSFAGYMGAMGFEWGSEHHHVSLASVQSLSIMLPTCKGEKILPIGSVEFLKKACEITGIELPKPLNIPDSLKNLLGRKVWVSTKSDLEYPCFVKPLVEVKSFTGFVAKSEEDFARYPELSSWNGMLFCSEILPEIISEWRCYVMQGRVFNCSCYKGDPLAFPDKNKILLLIEAYKDAPAGYSLDVAVTGDGTRLIECNDAWSLGYYGGDCVDYFRMIKFRWQEILKSQSE
jgi:hypothetical protein